MVYILQFIFKRTNIERRDLAYIGKTRMGFKCIHLNSVKGGNSRCNGLNMLKGSWWGEGGGRGVEQNKNKHKV